MTPIQTIIDLAPECHATSREKGWWDNERNEDGTLDYSKVYAVVPEKIALVHSELSEALEDWRVGKMKTVIDEKGKPTGFCSELADVAIRIFDLAGALGDKPTADDFDYIAALNCNGFGAGIAVAHISVSKAMEMYEHGGSGRMIMLALYLTVHVINILCDRAGGDLGTEMRRKMDLNLTRSYRHGGKLA